MLASLGISFSSHWHLSSNHQYLHQVPYGLYKIVFGVSYWVIGGVLADSLM